MSSLPSHNVEPQSFASKVWNFDDGKARKRAVKVAALTLFGVAPLIVRHLWRFDPPAYERHSLGSPFYNRETVLLGGCIAVVANAFTAYFTTNERRRRVCRSIVYGSCLAIVSPGIQVWLLMDWHCRLKFTPENPDNRLATFLWFPIVFGTLVGVSIARLKGEHHLLHMPRDGAFFPAVAVGCLLTSNVVAIFVVSFLSILEGVEIVLGW